MTTYDDKTQGVITSGGRFVLPFFKPCDEATFKASYIVASNVKCDGKITSLFDLIIIGDLEANEVDVKGKFVCIGKCKANTIIVYDEIWSEEITATSIETNSRITAQGIKAKTIVAEGCVLIARTLDIDSTAESSKAILCGETAFGAGMISAPILYTGEPLDLDDGEDAVIKKEAVSDQMSGVSVPSSENLKDLAPKENLIQMGETKFEVNNDYCGYLDFAISKAHDDEERYKFNRWKTILSEVELNCLSVDNCKNAVQLIWLSEVARSDHFENWAKIDEMFIVLDQHFADLIRNNSDEVVCTVSNYSELLRALSILQLNGDIISKEIYSWIYEQLISNLGLKPEFVYKRLNEKGWFNYD